MSIWKQAWLYVTRKKAKGILLFLLLFFISTALISVISVQQAASSMKQSMENNIKAGFYITTNSENNKILQSDAETVKTIDGISEYRFSLTTTPTLLSANLVENQQEGLIFTQEYEDELKNKITAVGSTDSALDHAFIGRRLKLIEGRHIQKDDKNKTLIHQDFAQKNNLKVGDKVTLANPAVQSSEVNAVIELEIVGVFTGQSDGKAYLPTQKAENTFYTDLISAQALAGMQAHNLAISEATFFVKDPSLSNAVMTKASELNLDWEHYTLHQNKDDFQGILSTAENMEALIQLMIGGILAVSIIILTLVLIFWIQSRMHEIGIMLSIGTSKLKIIAQHILEVLMIAVISFSISYFSGQLIAQTVGNQIVTQANQSNIEAENPSDSQITEMEISITAKDMAYVYTLGFGVIILSVGISSLAIVRLKPKEILSKMS